MRRASEAIILLIAVRLLGAQPAPDPNDVLARARIRIADTMHRIPKYTCLETINRSYFVRNPAPKRPAACVEAAAGKKGGGSLLLGATDRVRLEVAEGEAREIYAWPGESHFETGMMDELVSRGPTASGSFGGYLIDIFATKDARFNFVGARNDGGRQVFTYDYEVPQEKSQYKVKTGDDWVITAYSGEFDLDASSLELLRITVKTPELPPQVSLCRADSALEYSRVHIGDGDFLLPRTSQLHLVHRGGAESNSTTVFSECKEYLAESVFHVDGDETDSSKGGAAAAKVRAPLPVGVRMTLRLDAPIDTDAAAAGDAVTATAAKPLLDPISNEVLFREGAVAHGRIDRMEHWLTGSPYFLIGIHWISITQAGVTAPFAAIADRSGETNMITMGTIRPGLQRRPPLLGPPDALTFQTNQVRHVIPAHFEMKWVTVRPQ